MRLFRTYLLWPLFFVGHFLAIGLLTWHLLVQVNFLYPIGYRILAIETHIHYYGPKNRYKTDFAQTTSREHFQLFEDIVKAIQNEGKGLADISYRLADSGYTNLLRAPEIVHLQDVANLIDQFYRLGVSGGIIWALLLIYAYRNQVRLPALRKILGGFAIAVVVLTVGILLVGPTEVFYWLHVQIFPDEHEWFFYYQDSLMTTLMKAPDLFGFISVILLMLFAVLWALSLWAMTKLLNNSSQSLAATKKRKP